jgi:hypothetical protein
MFDGGEVTESNNSGFHKALQALSLYFDHDFYCFTLVYRA